MDGFHTFSKNSRDTKFSFFRQNIILEKSEIPHFRKLFLRKTNIFSFVFILFVFLSQLLPPHILKFELWFLIHGSMGYFNGWQPFSISLILKGKFLLIHENASIRFWSSVQSSKSRHKTHDNLAYWSVSQRYRA